MSAIRKVDLGAKGYRCASDMSRWNNGFQSQHFLSEVVSDISLSMPRVQAYWRPWSRCTAAMGSCSGYTGHKGGDTF